MYTNLMVNFGRKLNNKALFRYSVILLLFFFSIQISGCCGLLIRELHTDKIENKEKHADLTRVLQEYPEVDLKMDGWRYVTAQANLVKVCESTEVTRVYKKYKEPNKALEVGGTIIDLTIAAFFVLAAVGGGGLSSASFSSGDFGYISQIDEKFLEERTAQTSDVSIQEVPLSPIAIELFFVETNYSCIMITNGNGNVYIDLCEYTDQLVLHKEVTLQVLMTYDGEIIRDEIIINCDEFEEKYIEYEKGYNYEYLPRYHPNIVTNIFAQSH